MDDFVAKSKVSKIILLLTSIVLYLLSSLILFSLISYYFQFQQSYSEELVLVEILVYIQTPLVAAFILTLFFTRNFVSNKFKLLCSLPLLVFVPTGFYFLM